MKRRMIMAGVASATLLAGVYAFAQGPGGPWGPGGPPAPGGPPRMHGPIMHGPVPEGPMMRRALSERLDRALDRASVTPEQRVAIYASRDRVLAAIEGHRPDPMAQRDRMLALFEGAQLTQAQLDAFHQQADQQRQAIRAAFDRAMVEVHDTLTPAQRRIVAEYFRTHGPGGVAFRGMRGPYGPGAPGGPGMGPPAPR
jgi:hypothetical protein